MYFDTHCHLNFKVFEKNLSDVIKRTREAGVNNIVVPGTDIESSKKAVEIAEKYNGIYAAIGIHPHHVFDLFQLNKDSAKQFLSPNFATATMGRQRTSLSKKRDSRSSSFAGASKDKEKIAFASSYKKDLVEIENLLSHPKVVAVGEVGLDKHQYQKTKYQNYQINSEFIEDQKELLKIQIQLAIKHDKSLIIHNWEAGTELLNLLNKIWDKKLEGRTVFHCCEPDKELLNYAKEHKIYIGVDGDVTFNEKKQEFIKQVPVEMLVLETDSPYLLPRLRASFAGVATKAEQDFGGQAPLHFPNEPKNIPIIAEYIAKIKHVSINQLIDTTTENGRKLFSLS